MKIVTFNLRHGGRTKPPNSWQKLISEFSPDIVLAQESFGVDDYFSASDAAKPEYFIWQKVDGGKWGSVIASPNQRLQKIELTSHAGWVVGGMIESNPFGGDLPLLVFSLHTPSPGNYEKNTHEILDGLSRVISNFGPCDLIIGGDLNVTTAIRHPDEALSNTKGETEIIDRIGKEFGLANAWQAFHPELPLPQTLRWSGNINAAYHCDGLFIPIRYINRLSTVVIGESKDWNTWSDHNPIAALIETI